MKRIAIELQRLDEMHASLMPLSDLSPETVRLLVKIVNRRAKLLGLEGA